MQQDSFVAVSRFQTFPKWVFKADYKVVTQENMFEALAEIVEADHVAWDSEFEFTYHGHEVHAFSFSTKHGTGWLIPVAMDHVTNLPLEIVGRFLRAISLKENICQNSEAERRSVWSLYPNKEDFEYHCNITHDIQNLMFIRDPNESKDFKEGRPKGRRGGIPQGFSQESMANKYLRIEVPSLKSLFDAGVLFSAVDYHTARLYACADSDVCLRIFKLGADPSILDSFPYKLDMQLLPCLQEMEDTGVMIDLDVLKQVETELAEIVLEERARTYELLRLDPAANVDSPTQLARHITNVLNWPRPSGGAKRKDGLISTNKQLMERYAEHPDPQISKPAAQIKLYRSLKTLLSNYIGKLHEYVNPVTGAIHTSFLITVVPTGRLASASPNLQNVPKKRKDGRAPVRRAFRARPGRIFMEVDYSQIELRCLAGEAQEPYLMEAFANGEDLHAKAARTIFGHDNIDDDERQVGKMINFGLVYQMEAAGFAARTDFTVEESQRFIDDYFSAMPFAVAWINKLLEKAKMQGGVRGHFGRWRPLSQWLNSRNPADVAFGERSAVNTVIQGTASEILKIGLLRLYKKIWKGELNVTPILNVHDSVLLELDESEDFIEIFKAVESCMCFPIEGYPKLRMDAKIGYNWYDMKPLEEDPDEPEPIEDVQKQIPIPNFTDQADFLAKLVPVLKATSPGHIHVYFTKPDGSELPPVRMDGMGYQRVLQFLVSYSKAHTTRHNVVHPTQVGADDAGSSDTGAIPELSFA